jgi:hypothetical protein
MPAYKVNIENMAVDPLNPLYLRLSCIKQSRALWRISLGFSKDLMKRKRQEYVCSATEALSLSLWQSDYESIEFKPGFL